MKCDKCELLVEEYFDGELDQLSASSVSSHLENCSSCTAVLAQVAVEHRVYQAYDRKLDVSPAWWADVQAQLPGHNRRGNLNRFGFPQIEFGKLFSLRFSVAASLTVVVCAVLITVAVMKYLNKQEISKQLALSSQPRFGQTQPETGDNHEPQKPKAVEGIAEKSRTQEKTGTGSGPARGRSRPETGYAKTPPQLVREAEKKYLSAIALLTRDSQQRESQFDPETRARLDGALAAIDRMILSTRKAVQRNPNDPLAVQYMLAAYNKKIDVLKEMGDY